MNKIKIVTFDAFHTLVRPTGGAGIHYVKEASKYGYNVNKDRISENVSIEISEYTKKYPFYGMHHGITPKEWWKQVVYNTYIRSGISTSALDTHFPELFSTLYEKFASAEGYELYKDVHPVLSELKKRGIIMGVISNSDDRIIEVLKNLNIDHYFQFTLLSCQVGVEKPSLEMYQKALMTIKNFSKSATEKDILHVGDDAQKDYQGAINSGWNALLIDRKETLSKDNVPINHIIRSFNEILSLIDNSKNGNK